MKSKREKEEFEAVRNLIGQLPQLEQKAVIWIIRNIDIVELLCDPDDPYTEEKLMHEMQKARETQDYVYLALLMYQKFVQEQDVKNQDD